MNKCEKCLYNKNCQFIATHRKADVDGCTAFDDKSDMLNDIYWLISSWFAALEDEGVEPWRDNDCISIANKYGYTKEDYKKFCNNLV